MRYISFRNDTPRLFILSASLPPGQVRYNTLSSSCHVPRDFDQISQDHNGIPGHMWSYEVIIYNQKTHIDIELGRLRAAHVKDILHNNNPLPFSGRQTAHPAQGGETLSLLSTAMFYLTVIL